MKTILLTGSTGFIGTYFKDKYSDKYNIKTFSFLSNDLKNIDFTKIDIVVHLAGIVHKKDVLKYEDYEDANVAQTLLLAKIAKKHGVECFIFMSTVKVYGEETKNAYNEKSICAPVGYYGISKLKAEEKLLKLQDVNFNVSIIRTPLVYGQMVKANMKSLISLIDRFSILPFANINNKRSMVYIGNLSHLIDTLINKKQYGIFLASDDKPVSTTKLIELIANEFSKKVYLVEIPFFKLLIKVLKPSLYRRLYESLEVDNNQTKERLDFKNLYTIEDGIKYMIHGENK